MRCLLIGNYGAGNLGDALLARAIRESHPHVSWTTCSAEPGQTEVPRLPCGIRSLLCTPWWRTIGALLRSDAVVFGGGTLFTDSESLRACLIWWWHAAIAHLLRKPILLADQGIGPFRTRVGEWCARWVVERAAFLSVRDAKSCEMVMVWKKNTKVVLSFDPVFSLIEEENENNRTNNVFTIIPRNSRWWTEPVIERVRGGPPAQIVSFQPKGRELWTCQRIGGQTVAVHTLAEAMEAVHYASLILTERYHGLVLALALSVPVVALAAARRDKMTTLAEEAGIPWILLSEWDGDTASLHGGVLTAAQRQAFLARCEEGQRALADALRSLVPTHF